jgi:hypothetical protein
MTSGRGRARETARFADEHRKRGCKLSSRPHHRIGRWWTTAEYAAATVPSLCNEHRDLADLRPLLGFVFVGPLLDGNETRQPGKDPISCRQIDDPAFGSASFPPCLLRAAMGCPLPAFLEVADSVSGPQDGQRRVRVVQLREPVRAVGGGGDGRHLRRVPRPASSRIFRCRPSSSVHTLSVLSEKFFGPGPTGNGFAFTSHSCPAKSSTVASTRVCST